MIWNTKLGALGRANRATLGPKTLVGFNNEILGTVDRMTLAKGVIQLEGWSSSDRLRLSLTSGDVEITDRFERPDVPDAERNASSGGAGFAAMVGWDQGPVRLTVEHGAYVFVYDLVEP